MGRHVIGYEVQKVLAAADWFRRRNPEAKIGVAGYGEGGLIAFYSAAADTRIDAALVSGYFDNRQTVWSEPIYRNVWGLLREFGDAELATLIAPRGLVVEYSPTPGVTNQKGDLRTPPFDRVAAEFGRIDSLLAPGFQVRRLVSGDGHATGGTGIDCGAGGVRAGARGRREHRASRRDSGRPAAFLRPRRAPAPPGARTGEPCSGPDPRLGTRARGFLLIQGRARTCG